MAQLYINKVMNNIGEIVNLQIDSQNKTIDCEALLKGEDRNIIIKIEGYEVVENNGSYSFRFNNLTASREWIQILITHYAPANMFQIDPTAAKIIEFLI